jgi:hypothetical protein
MSGDLEEFLRRAAERRRERAAQQQAQQEAQQPHRRPRPEYTDRQAERVARAMEAMAADDEPLMGKPSGEEASSEALPEAHVPPPSPPAPPSPPLESPAGQVGLPTSEVSSKQLMEWMRTPAGLKQAILIREILDRPTHRWD